MEEKFFNDAIRDMVDPSKPNGSQSPDGEKGYDLQYDVISNSFRYCEKDCCRKELRLIDVKTRLSLIDLFYSTNLNRFSEFGIVELAKAIWNLCDDGTGFHTDATLVAQVEAFVAGQSQSQIEALFNTPRGISLKATTPQTKSIVSKYFYFLLEMHHSAGNDWGFPIYDSIVHDMLPKVYAKIFGKKISVAAAKQDIKIHVKLLHDIIEALEKADPALWQAKGKNINTKFGLLDFFLWRVGKAGKESFSLLWSKDEMEHVKKIMKNPTTTNVDISLIQKAAVGKCAELSRLVNYNNIYKSL